MQNRTAAIIITIVVALICLCAAIFACVWGVLGVTGTPINYSGTGITSGSAPMPQGLAIALLCLAVVFIAIPVAVGFFTLRRKPASAAGSEPQEPLPPTN